MTNQFSNAANEKINLLIVDDHMMVRDGIRTMLMHATKNSHLQFNIVEAENGKEAIFRVSNTNFDIVLIDYNMQGMNGSQTVEHILQIRPQTKIIALSNYDELSYIENMIKSGAKGYILKNIDPAELLKAIKTVLSGHTYYSSEVAVKMVEAKQEAEHKCKQNESQIPHKLTTREIEILKMIAMELTNDEIAEKLFISKRTVDTHRQNLLNKLNAKNTVGLVKAAYKFNLLKEDEK